MSFTDDEAKRVSPFTDEHLKRDDNGRPIAWGKGRRCNECGNPTWECACVPDNMRNE